jgi:GNAT superfamily N-acetyltransferase
MLESSRAATVADLPELVRLSAEGRADIHEARGGRLWLIREAPAEPLDQVFALGIESPMWLVQLALIDHVPLGFLLAEVDDRGGQVLAVARELYVMPEARGVGLGELLMDATVTWATNAGCTGIDGYALPGDRATKNYFETFGLVARGIVVNRRLGSS